MQGKKTFAFGAGRSDFDKTVINPKSYKADPENPDPGRYSPLKPLGKNTRDIKVKLKGKLYYGDTEHLATKRNIPPPG